MRLLDRRVEIDKDSRPSLFFMLQLVLLRRNVTKRLSGNDVIMFRGGACNATRFKRYFQVKRFVIS